MLLTPGVLFACYVIIFGFFASKGRFGLIADLIFVSVPFSILVVFLMRFTEQQRENARLVDDMKQAQEVQQILIPEKLPQVSGFRLEAVYRPAQQVGGDFFQILPLDDGGLLVIVGDVSGKGTRAAMLVAVIVGAARTIARDTAMPNEVLTRLNTELLGRMRGGFATCLVARISADGALTLANAGHLGPYINGVEIEVPHDLPLGVVAGLQYEVRAATLPAGGTMVMMTDGVVEAQGLNKELFGFDRTGEMMRQQKSAAEIATAAQAFGQQDDITVVSIERVLAAATSVA